MENFKYSVAQIGGYVILNTNDDNEAKKKVEVMNRNYPKSKYVLIENKGSNGKASASTK